MKSYKWHVYIFLAAMLILQPFLMEWLAVGGVSINFVLYFIMLFAFTKKKNQAITIAIVTGLVYDMLYSPWLGKAIIIFVAATVFVMLIDKRVYRENIPALAFFFLVATFVLENIDTLMETGLLQFMGNIGIIQLRLLYMSLYASALSIFAGGIYFIASIKRDRQLGMSGRDRYEV